MDYHSVGDKYLISYLTLDSLSVVSLMVVLKISKKQDYSYYELQIRRILIAVLCYSICGLIIYSIYMQGNQTSRSTSENYFVQYALMTQYVCMILSMVWNVLIGCILAMELYSIEIQNVHYKIFKLYSIAVTTILMVILIFIIDNRYDKKSTSASERDQKKDKLFVILIPLFIVISFMFLFIPLCVFYIMAIYKIKSIFPKSSRLINIQIVRLLLYPFILLFCIYIPEVVYLIHLIYYDDNSNVFETLSNSFDCFQQLYGFLQALAYGSNLASLQQNENSNFEDIDFNQEFFFESQKSQNIVLGLMTASKNKFDQNDNHFQLSLQPMAQSYTVDSLGQVQQETRNPQQ